MFLEPHGTAWERQDLEGGGLVSASPESEIHKAELKIGNRHLLGGMKTFIQDQSQGSLDASGSRLRVAQGYFWQSWEWKLSLDF